ncbi:chitobiase/beta-hexosaminidase C-terminal domain-containing protein [Methanobrevibacter ruminantium]|uniref:chitobiase/beta-hexosaminidase C-terminal domain-containing protein n=1 Tax=Methanobrevibacter ruminantium TaxID=83816 RepID=UPI0026EBC1A5|nr:chitobiase/beta-hexosaminidase C-terminal domain-containing protein [Methanobrevibacter ruminantium]
MNLTYGEDNKIFVKVKDNKDNILENKSVYLILNHAPHGVTDEEGRISVIAHPPGVWNCFYSFFGDEYYESSGLTVTYSIGVASPIVNYDSGIYNDSNLTVSISVLHGETIFYSWDNGISWNESLNNVSCTVMDGNWTLKTYTSLNGYNSSTVQKNFLVGNLPPNVWASYESGIYNDSFSVELFAEDSNDEYPLIYYTYDGSLPNVNSSVYSYPIYVSNSSNFTNLRFFAIYKYGSRSNIVNVYYFFGDVIANLNSGKIFNNVQEAIDDNCTSNGDVIWVSTDIFGPVNINKEVILKACSHKPVNWYGINDQSIVNIVCDNVIIDGFNFTGSNVFNLKFANNCSILNNYVYVEKGYGFKIFHCSYCNVINNTFYANNSEVTANILSATNHCSIISNKILVVTSQCYLSFSEFNASDGVYNLNVNHSIARLKSNLTNLINKEIIMIIDGIRYDSFTNDYGEVHLPLSLSEGLHEVILYFKGDRNYLSTYRSFNLFAVDNEEDITISTSYDSGFYNTSNLLVNFSSFEGAIIFCSFDNGSSWNKFNNSICYNLTEGVWDLLVYCSLYDFNSSIYNYSFVIGNSSPLVWSNYGSGIYQESFYVNLSSFSSIDDDMLIYYTLDGSLPTTESLIYNHPIFVSNQSTLTTLSFFASDKYGHISDVISINYFFGNLIVNLNTGKVFSTVQDAIDDADTSVGDVIEISCNLNESAVLNKSVNLRSCDYHHVNWTTNYPNFLLSLNGVNDIFIEGFVFNYFDEGVVINLNGSSNCIIVDNIFLMGDGISILDFGESYYFSYNNSILSNSFLGNSSAFILLNNIENYSFIDNYFNQFNKVKDGFISSLTHCNLGYGYGIFLNSSVNSVFYENNFVNGSFALCINNSINNYFANNRIYNNSKAIGLEGANNVLFNNSFALNEFAIVIDGINNSIISNVIVDNDWGIYSNVSSFNLSVNFNRISNNYNFGVFIIDGSANASNNWWGHNNVSLGENNCDLYFTNNSNVSYESYLVLSIYADEYKIKNFFAENCSFLADLTHNNLGEDVSIWGYVPDCDIIFDMSCNYYDSEDNLVNENNSYVSKLALGKSSHIFDLKLNNNVSVFLDNEIVSYFIGCPPQSLANISISSTAIICNNNTPLNYNLIVPFNDSVNWFNVIWRSVGLFEDEIYIIVDGDIIDSFNVENSFYHQIKSSYSEDVFNAIKAYNKFLYNNLYQHKAVVYAWISLISNLNDLNLIEGEYYSNNWEDVGTSDLNRILAYHNTDFNSVLLNILMNSYNLSSTDMYFINQYHDMFMDNITVAVSYLCSSSSSFNIHSDDDVESFYWLGDFTCRKAVLSYDDGIYPYTTGDDSPVYYDLWETTHYSNGTVKWNYHNSYGYYTEGNYDGFLTFTFASDKVADDVLDYWLNEKNRTYDNGSLYYENGFMKAAYGSFLEVLDVIYCSDLCADIAAVRFNVTWERTSPMVMSVRDDMFGTVLSGECSFYFGRSAYGDPDAVKAFYFACSASFSPIEHYVTHALFPNSGDNGSATIGLGFILDSGGEIEIVQDGDLTLIREIGSNEKILLFDSTTGLMHDQIMISYNGAYCYSDQQTDWACEFAQDMLNAKDDIWDFVFNNSFMDWANNDVLGIAGSVSMSVGIACLPAFPVGTVVGLSLIGFGLYSTYYANDLNNGITDQRLANFGLDVGLSLIPFVGLEGKVAKTVVSSDAVIGRIVLSRGVGSVSDKIVTRSSFAFEKYLIERGESELLYNGLSRVSTKFGTLESAYRTLYGNTYIEQIKSIGESYFLSYIAHFSIDNFYTYALN